MTQIPTPRRLTGRLTHNIGSGSACLISHHIQQCRNGFSLCFLPPSHEPHCSFSIFFSSGALQQVDRYLLGPPYIRHDIQDAPWMASLLERILRAAALQRLVAERSELRRVALAHSLQHHEKKLRGEDTTAAAIPTRRASAHKATTRSRELKRLPLAIASTATRPPTSTSTRCVGTSVDTDDAEWQRFMSAVVPDGRGNSTRATFASLVEVQADRLRCLSSSGSTSTLPPRLSLSSSCRIPVVSHRLLPPARFRHPAWLFDDDDGIVRRFGMGCFASPPSASCRRFSALFRQRWQDFHVTEMEFVAESSQGGGQRVRPLSRVYDFTIPPLPDSAIRTAAARHVGAAGSSDDDGSDGDIFKLGEGDRQRSRQLVSDKKETELRSWELKRDREREAVDRDGDGALDVDSNKQHHLYVQAYLHKQHLAHATAMSILAQSLRLHPSAISVAGIKDLIGDTIQRVRVRGSSPAALREVSQDIQRNKPHLKFVLSHFSYHDVALRPGDLYGNRFKIVLRDVDSDMSESDVAAVVRSFEQKGFPNYYGCQRFSWFGGKDDVAFAMLNHNWLVFAFRLLNFTEQNFTLRELLQRPNKYPTPIQDQYRRNVVRRLRKMSIEPKDLDVPLFMSPPSSIGDMLQDVDGAGRVAASTSSGAQGGGSAYKQQRIMSALREAFFDLDLSTRRMTAQRLASFFWNQVLTLRLHHFGAEEVLVGDLVFPKVLRSLPRGSVDPQEAMTIVTEENKHLFTIEDVVHPAFQFERSPLPKNAVGQFYMDVCEKYRLDWAFKHVSKGMRDFQDPPRPILRKPENLSYEFDKDRRVLTLEFDLERGCYANVAVSELMKLERCAGSDKILMLPAPQHMWGKGGRDPGYVVAAQDVYVDWVDGEGFVNESVDPAEGSSSETPTLFDWMEHEKQRNDGREPKLFLEAHEDPARKARKWSEANLLRNSRRRLRDADDLRKKLFEKSLAKDVDDGELQRYAGHHVPMPPNAKAKQIFFKVQKRARRFRGAPKARPTVRMGAHVANANAKRATFSSLTKGTWNVTW